MHFIVFLQEIKKQLAFLAVREYNSYNASAKCICINEFAFAQWIFLARTAAPDEAATGDFLTGKRRLEK